MGWFEEQIKERIQNDDAMMSDALSRIACAITGQRISMLYDSDRMHAQEAINEILCYYHIKSRELPETVKTLDEVLEFQMRPSGFMRRPVNLAKGWYKDASGPMLASTKDGKTVALIPGKFFGYSYADQDTGRKIKVNSANEDLFEEAICFYRPMPVRKMNTMDFIRYISGVISAADMATLFAATIAIMLIGLAAPVITQFLYSRVLASGSSVLLWAAVLTLFLTGVSSALMSAFKTSVLENVKIRARLAAQAATMMRILSVPASFFKEYSSGDLANRAWSVENLSDILIEIAFSTGLSAVFSLVYIGQIFVFAPELCWPAFAIVLITFILISLASFLGMKSNNEYLPLAAKESGIVYALFGGISKIKNAGAEKRAFAKWASAYSTAAKFRYNDYLLVRLKNTCQLAITLFGTLILYKIALSGSISTANYMAFTAAYSMVSGAFLVLAGGMEQIAAAGSVIKMASPILQAVPEMAENKPVIDHLSGSIELNNISFRYSENMPNVLDNISLKIHPGEYVAIVGKTGCGKSTLLRILLGFEKPQKGAVYYDGRDLNSVDIKSLRRKIGVVTQNGKLFMGDIYSNIVISKPDLSMDAAWEAARLAGMEDDIRKMPMKMQTLIMEGSGGISGGQRQRILIARAIAPKPKILMFDEATSALDNITQKIVSESLNSLKCTRLVIAHRLSTIVGCDRIILLDGGHVAEEGTYEELMAEKGQFYKLVERQRVDLPEN